MRFAILIACLSSCACGIAQDALTVPSGYVALSVGTYPLEGAVGLSFDVMAPLAPQYNVGVAYERYEGFTNGFAAVMYHLPSHSFDNFLYKLEVLDLGNGFFRFVLRSKIFPLANGYGTLVPGDPCFFYLSATNRKGSALFAWRLEDSPGDTSLSRGTSFWSEGDWATVTNRRAVFEFIKPGLFAPKDQDGD